MATSGGVQVGGLLSSAKGIGGKLGSVAGKLGQGLGRLADSKAAGWATDKVRSLTVNDQVIKGWQDVYKGVKTLEGNTKIIRTVRYVAEGRASSGAAQAAKASGRASKAASAAGRAIKATGKAAKATGTASNGAGVTVRAASGARVAGSIKKIKIPGGFKEVTKVDVTKAEFVGKAAKSAKVAKAVKAGKMVRGSEAGLKVVKGTKFKLGGSAAEGRVISAGSRASTASGNAAGRSLHAVKSGAGAKGALKGAKGAKVTGSAAKGAKGAAKVAKGAKGAAGRGGNVVSETTTTITQGAKGFKKPFGIQAIKAGFKNIFQGAMKAAKVSGIVNLVISVVSNGYGVMSGQIGLPEALGAVARDTATGFVAGGFAAIFSGGVLAVAGAFGLTAGLPIFLLGLGASLIGYIICDAMFNAIIGDKIKSGVQHLFGG